MAHEIHRVLLLSQELDVAVFRCAVILDLAAANYIHDLLDSFDNSPTWQKPKLLTDLAEISLIVAPVARIGRSDNCAGDHFANQFSDLLNRIVLFVTADVENLSVDSCQRRFHRVQDCQRGIINVQEWTPLVTALNGYLAIANGFRRQQIDNEIESRAA